VTGHSARTAHHWLTQHSRALSHVLDTEAGLREILLRSHHDTATDALDTVLHTEAGLASILLGPATAPPNHIDTTDTVSPLLALSPADRMVLRHHPDVRKASRALATVHRSVHRRTRAFNSLLLASVREATVDLARALVLDLDLSRTHIHACAFDLDQYVHEIARLPEALDRDFELALDDAHCLARRLTSDLTSLLDVRAHLLPLDRAFRRARDLVYALGLGWDLVHAPDVEYDIIRTTCRILIAIRVAELRRAIGQTLNQPPPMLDEPTLLALLNNFTTADLTTADLTGIDLSGVHWSEHTTRWPPDIDSDDLKTRSHETHPGSGIWIVHSGTATIRDLAL